MSLRNETMKGSFTEYFKTGLPQTTTVTSDTLYELKSDSKRRRPNGWVPPTAYTLDYRVNRGHTGTWVNPQNQASLYRVGQLGKLANHSSMDLLPLPGNARNDAIIKALLKLKDQSVNLGVAFAEAQATADLVGTTATKLARAVQAIRRKDPKAAFRALDLKPNKRVGRSIQRGGNVTNKWLELQYGWLPLMSDIAGSVKALSRQQRGNMMQTVTARVQTDDFGVAKNITNGYAGRADYTFKRESGYFIRMDFFPGNDFTNAMSRAGMTNPFEVAWERVPFSFVADWFLPVGDFLASLDATIGWEFAGGSESYFRRVSITSKQALETNAGSSFSGAYKRVDLKRNVLTAPPIPMRPGFKNPLSVGHMANGLSLLASVVGGIRRPWFNNS